MNIDEKDHSYALYQSFPEINNLVISRYSHKDSFLHFSAIKLGNLNFENFSNLGNITFSNCSIDHNIDISFSDLGKCVFINCNFSNNALNFNSAKINDISLPGSAFPLPTNINSQNEAGETNFTQKQLALSQLKKVYQTMGDNITSSTYHAEELNTYRK